MVDVGSQSLTDLDATEQSQLIQNGQCSAVELVQAAIDAAERVNPELNAIIHPRYEEALAEAQHPKPGVLSGVPIVIKDLDGSLAGAPLHLGCNHLRRAGYFATETSVLFQRLIDAGAIIIGATNTPEFGLVPSTEPQAYGATKNPWDTTRSPAGSSGGSAAAVAARIVPLGHAGDGGGSIRLPASVCGLVGLKPSRGLVPNYPDIDPWGGLVARLGITRTVRDTALLMDALADPDPLDAPQSRGVASDQYRSLLDSAPSGLRVGVVNHARGHAIDPKVAQVVSDTAAVLADMGHHVSEGGPVALESTVDGDVLASHFLTVYPVWVARVMDDVLAMAGTEVEPGDFEPHTAALADLGKAVSAVEYHAALYGLNVLGRNLRSWWDDGHDLLLTPVVGELPWTLGQFSSSSEDPLGPIFRSVGVVPFMSPFNISGQPAISLPMGMVDGLPVGVQLVAAWGREDLLLSVAAELERHVNWDRRRPPVCA